jgi:hypothetical protein
MLPRSGDEARRHHPNTVPWRAPERATEVPVSMLKAPRTVIRWPRARRVSDSSGRHVPIAGGVEPGVSTYRTMALFDLHERT